MFLDKLGEWLIGDAALTRTVESEEYIECELGYPIGFSMGYLMGGISHGVMLRSCHAFNVNNNG